MLMDAGMDTGDIVLQKRINFVEADYGGLHDELALFGGDLLGESHKPCGQAAAAESQSGEASNHQTDWKEDTMISLDWPPDRFVMRFAHFATTGCAS